MQMLNNHHSTIRRNEVMVTAMKLIFYASILLAVFHAPVSESKDLPVASSNPDAVGLPPIHNANQKPFPSGLYESGGPIQAPHFDTVARTQNTDGQDGVLVRVHWDLCGNDIDCLIDTIELNLNTAESLGLKVALAVSDGHNVPPDVKDSCELFSFLFQQQSQTMCEVWDTNYLSAKAALIQLLGENFDDHPALGYVYFTTACSTNGYEGHCRIDRNDYIAAGYTENVFDNSFAAIMQFYLDSFDTTPIVFEAHTIFNRTGMWESIWSSTANSNQVGVAVWWCSERLSLRGNETLPVWPLVQTIAKATFAVCQTVGQFTQEPYRFSDSVLGFDYGLENDWDQTDVLNAFHDTIQWMSGLQTMGDQTENIAPFSVLEAWTEDLKNPLFQDELPAVLDILYINSFESEGVN